MKEHGGSIVDVCSKAAESGAVASKHGLLGVTRNTAFQFRDKGIRCNAVLPGGKDTRPQNMLSLLLTFTMAVKTNILSTLKDVSWFDQERLDNSR
jgi:NAD(P)-dependent dehydrogenase (short-subunit alcohol dehydrogenase family)